MPGRNRQELETISDPSCAMAGASSVPVEQGHVAGGLELSVTPWPAKISEILPTANASRPAALARSSSRARAAGWRSRAGLAVRLEVVAVSPVAKGRRDDPGRSAWARRGGMRSRRACIVATKSEMALVRGDLEHRVGGRVADGLAGADQLLRRARR